MTRRIAFRCILGLAILLPVELGSQLACRFLAAKGVFYEAETGDFVRYLRLYDPELGWPSPSTAAQDGRDAAGARRSPAFPSRDASPPLVAAYGDSFTWADEVSDTAAWPELLGTRIGARVDNFGVGGYGSDQALLRARQKAASGTDRAPLVLLAHLSENVIRNLNQFRGLIAPGSGGLGFKPRFELGADGRLGESPLPLPRPEAYAAAVRDPDDRWLPHETFLPGSAEGPRRARFPYLWSLARAAGHPRLRAFAAREPYYARFYEPGHPARGTELCAAILDSFGREAAGAGRLSLVVLLPTGLDLERFARTGRWTYAPLLEALAARSVPALDLGPILAQRSAGTPLAALFVDGDVGRHFGEVGNRLVAEAVYEELEASGLLTRARAKSRRR